MYQCYQELCTINIMGTQGILSFPRKLYERYNLNVHIQGIGNHSLSIYEVKILVGA